MVKLQYMYFDEILRSYKKQIEEKEAINKNNIWKFVSPKFLSGYPLKLPQQNLEQQRIDNEKRTKKEIKKHLVDILNESKIFLINGAVVDDLYNIPSDTTNYEAAMHLPFPIIFFELIDTLEITLLRNEKINVKAMLFGEGKDAGAACRWVNEKAYAPGSFYVGLFHNKMRQDDLPKDIYIDPSSLKNIETEKIFLAMDPFENKDYTAEADKISTAKIINLCVNIVDYINAANVVIKKTERTTDELVRLNRKRAARGRKPFELPKPFYWVEIKPIEITIVERKKESRIEAHKMDYREMVRGHFQKYHTNDGIIKNWIMSYPRGPEDAPWKEKRYEVLYNKLMRGHIY